MTWNKAMSAALLVILVVLMCFWAVFTADGQTTYKAPSLSTTNVFTGKNTFGQPVTVGTPVDDTDAATKLYVDEHAASGMTDATTDAKGAVKLVHDLAGTAAAPEVTGMHGTSGVVVTTDGVAVNGLKAQARMAATIAQGSQPQGQNVGLHASYIETLNGGHNQYPYDIQGRSTGLLTDKTNWWGTYLDFYKFTIGQVEGSNAQLFCNSNGDCLGIAATVWCASGQSAGGDEGCEGGWFDVEQQTTVPVGTIAAVSGETLTLTMSGGGWTRGQDRPIVNLSRGAYSTGTASINATTDVVTGSGTDWATAFGTGAQQSLWFCADWEAYSGNLWCAPVSTVGSGTQLTLAHHLWTGATPTGAYHLYRASPVTEMLTGGKNPATVLVAVADGSVYQVGDSFQQPIDSRTAITGQRVIFGRVQGPDEVDVGLDVVNDGARRAQAMIQLNAGPQDYSRGGTRDLILAQGKMSNGLSLYNVPSNAILNYADDRSAQTLPVVHVTRNDLGQSFFSYLRATDFWKFDGGVQSPIVNATTANVGTANMTTENVSGNSTVNGTVTAGSGNVAGQVKAASVVVQTPTMLPSAVTTAALFGWWKADAQSYTDGQSVTSVTDSSGNSHTLTSSHAPVFKTNIVNSLAVMRFVDVGGDGNNLTLGSLTLAQPLTYFVVMKRTGDSTAARTYNTLISGDGGVTVTDAPQLAYQGDVSHVRFMTSNGTNTAVATAALADTAWHVTRAEFNGASGKLYVDGTLAGSNNTGTIGATSLIFGAGDTSGHYPFSGDIAEIIVYEGVLSAVEATQVENQLKNKYGTLGTQTLYAAKDTSGAAVFSVDSTGKATATEVATTKISGVTDTGVVANLHSANSDAVNGHADTYFATASGLTAHTGNTSNPHSVTKAQVGLTNADNTADSAKPVSTPQQTALDTKPIKPVADCHNATTSKVIYDQASNQLSCGTDQGGGSGMTNPMSSTGDTIYSSDSSGTAARLAANATATKKYLQSVSGGVPGWFQVAFADLGSTPTTLGGYGITDALASSTVLPANTTATTHQFFTAYNSTTGGFTKAAPACADISDAGTGCSTTVGTAATSTPDGTTLEISGTTLRQKSGGTTTTQLSAGGRARAVRITDIGVTNTDIILALEEGVAVTLTSFLCQIDTGTSVLVDVYTRAWATTGIGSTTSQVTVLSGQYTATPTSAATTSFAAAAVAANTPVVIRPGTVTGATALFCTIHYTVDTGQ